VKTALQLAFLLQLLLHPGGLDSNGRHHDRRNGGYHYHVSHAVGVPNDDVAQEALLAAAREESFRREARMTARMQARDAARTVVRRDDGDLPKTLPKPVVIDHEFRTWTDTTGKFSVVAKFGGYVPERVRLVKQDATEIHVDIEILSNSDKGYLRTLLARSGVRTKF
jgi:SLA1 homology domain 1, SHD1